jgi:peroxiredoxin-like protein
MAALTEHTYNVDLQWKEGRLGVLSSKRLTGKIEVATPPEFTGGMEGVWSPEHLFIASVSSCFMTTFNAITEYSKLHYEQLSVEAVGTMSNASGKFAITEIILKPKLVITDTNQKEKAIRILQKSEEACLITRSINTKVILEPEVLVSKMA